MLEMLYWPQGPACSTWWSGQNAGAHEVLDAVSRGEGWGGAEGVGGTSLLFAAGYDAKNITRRLEKRKRNSGTRRH